MVSIAVTFPNRRPKPLAANRAGCNTPHHKSAIKQSHKEHPDRLGRPSQSNFQSLPHSRRPSRGLASAYAVDSGFGLQIKNTPTLQFQTRASGVNSVNALVRKDNRIQTVTNA